MDPEALLVAERRELAERLARLRSDLDALVAASRDANADDEHDPEGHTIAFERAQWQALERRATLHLAEIEAALDRCRSGSFGACERCGRAIDVARLEARPTARHCLPCAARR